MTLVALNHQKYTNAAIPRWLNYICCKLNKTVWRIFPMGGFSLSGPWTYTRLSLSLPLLRQLHWLPLTYRIHFKLYTLTYHTISTQQPPYLANLLHLSNIHRQLRSFILQLIVPWANVVSLSLDLWFGMNSPSL